MKQYVATQGLQVLGRYKYKLVRVHTKYKIRYCCAFIWRELFDDDGASRKWKILNIHSTTLIKIIWFRGSTLQIQHIDKEQQIALLVLCVKISQ